MKRILVYFLFIFVIPGTIAVSLISILKPRIEKENRLSALEYCDVNRDYNDILFIGSSRVRQHIDPLIIDSITHLKSYNLSVDAAGIVECNLLLNKYLQHHRPPHYLFMNMDVNTFDIDMTQPFITDYFDYLDDSIVRRCLGPYRVAYRNKYVQGYYKFLKFFSTNDRDKNNVLFPGKINQDFDNKALLATGFFPRGYNWDKKTQTKKNHYNYSFDQRGVNLLKAMVDKCQKDSIHLAFMFAPFYKPFKPIITNYDSLFNKIVNLSKQENVPFLDYSNMSMCDSISYFNSILHLNTRGALIYTRHLGEDIKDEFLDSTGRYYQPSVIYHKSP